MKAELWRMFCILLRATSGKPLPDADIDWLLARRDRSEYFDRCLNLWR